MNEFFRNLYVMIHENYDDIFKEEYRDYFKADYPQNRYIYYLSFGFLKIVDSSLKFSKKDVIEEYEEYGLEVDVDQRLYHKSIFPDGDYVGFYNYSKYDLESLVNNKATFESNFKEYLESFDKNIRKVFENYEFNHIIEFLSSNNILYEFICDLNKLEIKDYLYKDSKNLKLGYESFLNEFYIMEEQTNKMPLGGNARNYILDLLIKILMTDINFKKKNKITIFDPFCDDGFLLFETKRRILKINPKCDVELFGKENNKFNYAKCLSKMIIDKENPNNLFKTYELESNFVKLNDNLTFDLIISNFGIHDINLNYRDLKNWKFKKILDFFVSKLNKNGKLVSTFSSYTVSLEHILVTELIYRDYLELIIRMGLLKADLKLYILSVNKKKNKKRKNKFLLIDSNEILYELENMNPIERAVPLFDKFYEYYFKFKDNPNIHLFMNSYLKDREYDEFRKSKFKFSDYDNLTRLFEDNPDLMKYYFDNVSIHFNFNRLIRGKKEKFTKEDFPLKYLGEIVDLMKIQQSDSEELSDIFLIPNYKDNISNERPFFLQSELRKSPNYEIISFTITDNNILKKYLLYYLNSNQGKYELVQCMRNGNYITRPDLRFIQVPVPPIEIQKEVINAVEKSKEFFESVNLLKNNFQNNILDYEHILEDIDEFRGEIEFSQDEYKFTKMDRNWRHVYEGLPWPLAITYLSATLGGFEKVQKANAYLKLFEFVTLFNAIVLLSGIPDEYYNEFKDKYIWTKPDKFYSFMTFGKWFKLYKFIKNLYLRNEFKPVIDSDLFEQLCNEKIFRSLSIAKNVRNGDAHGPITNEYEAEEVIKYLEPLLNDTFDNLTSFSDFKFYYVIGKFERTDSGNLKQDVIMLNGPCAQPIYRELIYEKELDAHALYFYNPLTNDLFKLKDNLIKFIQTDRIKNNWALFIYSGWEFCKGGKNAIYRCYQQTEKDIVESISSFSEDIK